MIYETNGILPIDTAEEYQFRLNMNEPNTFIPKGEKTINVLSLFSGCGGMDLGLEGGFTIDKRSISPIQYQEFIEKEISSNLVKLKTTKFRTVFANDILKEAQIAWINYFTKLGYNKSIFHSESIVDLVKAHKASGNIFPKNIDIVTGGFPCQDFSVAGKRNGFNSHRDHNGKTFIADNIVQETRGKLYSWMKEVIDITKPKIFIAENVKGLVNFSNIKEIIQQDFSTADENGYIVLEPKVLHAANYGVPQSRERVFFIGIKKSALNKNALSNLSKEKIPEEYDPYPLPSHIFKNKDIGLVDTQTLRNIFSILEEPEKSNDPSQMHYSKAKYMGVHCQGQIEINLDGIGPTIRAEHHGNIEYRRLSKTNGGKIDDELENGLKERRLTPRECALIQTFPLDYQFVIPKENNNRAFTLSPSASYKIIGNAVPPLLAYHIGKRIEKLWTLYFE